MEVLNRPRGRRSRRRSKTSMHWLGADDRSENESISAQTHVHLPFLRSFLSARGKSTKTHPIRPCHGTPTRFSEAKRVFIAVVALDGTRSLGSAPTLIRAQASSLLCPTPLRAFDTTAVSDMEFSGPFELAFRIPVPQYPRFNSDRS